METTYQVYNVTINVTFLQPQQPQQYMFVNYVHNIINTLFEPDINDKKVVPKGLQNEVLQNLEWKDEVHACPTLKLLAARAFMFANGIEATLNCANHMDYETRKNLLRPLVWWQ